MYLNHKSAVNKFQWYCVKSTQVWETQISSTSAAMVRKRRAGTSPLLAGSHCSSWHPWAEARQCSARQSSEKTPQLPPILVCLRSEPIFLINRLQNPTVPFFKTNEQKKTYKQDECFWLKDRKHSPITREELFPQYVPNEKSVALLLVARHTSSHAARTTSCTRLSLGEIQLQN